eukprot:Colp12_sorted_trinity150504_noHs@11316
MYWAIITAVTVGYGDITPTTTWGKILACCLAIMGAIVFAIPAGIISSSFAVKAASVGYERRMNQKFRKMAALAIQCQWRARQLQHPPTHRVTAAVLARYAACRHEEARQNDESIRGHILGTSVQEDPNTDQTFALKPDEIPALRVSLLMYGSYAVRALRDMRKVDKPEIDNNDLLSEIRTIHRLISNTAVRVEHMQESIRLPGKTDVSVNAKQPEETLGDVVASLRDITRGLEARRWRPGSALYSSRDVITLSMYAKNSVLDTFKLFTQCSWVKYPGDVYGTKYTKYVHFVLQQELY